MTNKTRFIAAALSLALIPAAQAAPQLSGAGFSINQLGDDVPGDFNEDGTPDFLWMNSERGTLQVWMTRDFKPVEMVSTNPSTVGTQVVAIGTDDFDGDNKTDIAFWQPDTGAISFWHMDGVNLLYKTDLAQAVQNAVPVSILDFDRDGNPDILFQNDSHLFVTLIANNQIVAKVDLDLPSAGPQMSWSVMGTGDFDRDGDRDLVLYHKADGYADTTGADLIAVAHMDGTVGTITVVTEMNDRNWSIRSVADYNRDGHPDLIFENDLTNQTAGWAMQGLKILDQFVITENALRRTWNIVGPR